MRLNELTFDPQQTPEAQHQLRQVPPAERVDHPKLKAALESYERARKAEHEARLTHVQLEQELPAAEWKDEEALANAREKRAKDPGPVNADRHRAAIAEAKRDWGARKIALARSIEAVREAWATWGDEFEASLLKERDKLRGAMGELLDGWQRLHVELQRNAANRAIARGSASQSVTLFADSIKVPQVRDGDVIFVADAVAGLRDLAKPQAPNDRAVENLEQGAEPTRHVPPAQQPHFSGGGPVQMGARRDPAVVREWQERDEAEALARGAALTDEKRQERMTRVASRQAEREARREAEDEAIAATRP
jgi:hypothetical protein